MDKFTPWHNFASSLRAKLGKRLLRTLILVAILICLLLSRAVPARGQLPTLRSELDPPKTLPDQVRRVGEYETAPIYSPLDGRELFEVTSPTVLDRSKIAENKFPVELRAQAVNERLLRALTRTITSKRLPVVSIATLNQEQVILISDDHSSRPLRLVTVTEPDAELNGKTLTELAQDWQKIIEKEVQRFRELAAPEVLLQRLGQALLILLGLIVSSALIWGLRRLLNQRQQILQARLEESAAIAAHEKAAKESVASPLEPEFPTHLAEHQTRTKTSFRATIKDQFSLKKRLEINQFLKWLLLWIFILAWYIGIYKITATIPILMRVSTWVLTTPLLIVLTWFVISLAVRLSESFIDRFMFSRQSNSFFPLGEGQRVTLRSISIAGALKGFIAFVLVVVGILFSLSLLGIPTGSIIAGGAVVGLTISFGTQSLVKDLVNGCLILIEDQFAVGDIVEIDNKSGLVENLNLRVTQLRNAEGQLITIPNSMITNVSNLTRLWSRIDFSIVVAYENDPNQVLEVLHQVADQLYQDPVWRASLPEPPDVLGIDHLSHEGMLVRVWIKTTPLEQWNVGREFRLRVCQAFTANQIQIGRPEARVYNTSLESTQPISEGEQSN